jgi:hypothetical protein
MIIIAFGTSAHIAKGSIKSLRGHRYQESKTPESRLIVSGGRRSGGHRHGGKLSCGEPGRAYLGHLRQQRRLRHDWRTDGVDDADRSGDYDITYGPESREGRPSGKDVRSPFGPPLRPLSRESVRAQTCRHSQSQEGDPKGFRASDLKQRTSTLSLRQMQRSYNSTNIAAVHGKIMAYYV